MAKLNILGSGVGMPTTNEDGSLQYPPGYLLESNKSKILIECSPGVEFQLKKMGTDFSDVSTIVISHFHPDHFSGIVNFAFFHKIRNEILKRSVKKLNIIGPKGVKERFYDATAVYWEKESSPFKNVNLKFIELDGKNNTYVLEKNIKVKGFPTFHESSNTKALSLRFEFTDGSVLSYSGDSGKTKSLIKSAEDSNIFLCEISADVDEDLSKYGHLNPREAGEVAKIANTQKLLLTHYWRNDSDRAIGKEIKRSGYKGKVHIVKDFETYSF